MTPGSEPAWPVWLPRHLLTPDEAAKILNVSLRSVRRLIKGEKLQTVRVGRLVRIRPETLAALIEDQ